MQDLVDFASVPEVDSADDTASHGAIKEDAAKPSPVSETRQRNESLPNPFVALARSHGQFEKAAKKSGFYGHRDDVAPLQNDLLLAYITEAFCFYVSTLMGPRFPQSSISQSTIGC